MLAEALALLSILAPPAPSSVAPPPESAGAVAERLVAAMGGRKAWDDLPGLAFDFVVRQREEREARTARTEEKEIVRRSHVWDKWNSRHRLEMKTPDGKPVVVDHSVSEKDDPEARVTIGGKVASGDERAAWSEKAHAIWVNDVYWLAMPWKLSDPGVRLETGGEETSGTTTSATPSSRMFDILALSFDGGTGLTCGDRYKLFVERGGSGLLGRWEYVLEGQEPPPIAWTWEDWISVGGVKFSTRRIQVDGPREIRIEKLEVRPKG